MIAPTTHGVGIAIIELMIVITIAATIGVTVATTTIATHGAVEIEIAITTKKTGLSFGRCREHFKQLGESATFNPDVGLELALPVVRSNL